MTPDEARRIAREAVARLRATAAAQSPATPASPSPPVVPDPVGRRWSQFKVEGPRDMLQAEARRQARQAVAATRSTTTNTTETTKAIGPAEPPPTGDRGLMGLAVPPAPVADQTPKTSGPGIIRSAGEAVAGTAAGVVSGGTRWYADIKRALGLAPGDQVTPEEEIGQRVVEGAAEDIYGPAGAKPADRRRQGPYRAGVGVGETIAGFAGAPVSIPVTLGRGLYDEAKAQFEHRRNPFGDYMTGKYRPGAEIGGAAGELAGGLVPGFGLGHQIRQVVTDPNLTPDQRSEAIETLIREHGAGAVAALPGVPFVGGMAREGISGMRSRAAARQRLAEPVPPQTGGPLPTPRLAGSRPVEPPPPGTPTPEQAAGTVDAVNAELARMRAQGKIPDVAAGAGPTPPEPAQPASAATSEAQQPAPGAPPEPASPAPTTPPVLSRESLKSAFNLTNEQAEATNALVESMGLDKERIRVEKGGEAGSGALYQPEISRLGFYSNTEKALESWQPRGTPDQLRKHLDKFAGTKEEMKWIGLDDFIASKGKEPISRAEIEDYIKQNKYKVEIKERVLGENLGYNDEFRRLKEEVENYVDDPEDYTLDDLIEVGVDEDVASEYVRLRRDVGNMEAKFGPEEHPDYSLPGDPENYREVIMTLPKPQVPVDTSGWRVERLDGGYTVRVITPGGRVIISKVDPSKSMSDQYVMDQAIQKQQEEGSTLFGKQRGHFPFNNVVMHLRTTDRYENGKKIFMIEESQSDWAQKARKQFKEQLKDIARRWNLPEKASPKEIEKALMDLKTEDPEGRASQDLDVLKHGGFVTKGEVERLDQEFLDAETAAEQPKRELAERWGIDPDRALNSVLYELQSIERYKEFPRSAEPLNSDQLSQIERDIEAAKRLMADVSRVGDRVDAIRQNMLTAPFVTKTPDWASLGMKWAMWYAVKNGYDQIAWTTGEQQVLRWEQALRKQVDGIAWTKGADGKIKVEGYKKEENRRRYASTETWRLFTAAMDRNENFNYSDYDEAADSLRSMVNRGEDWRQELDVTEPADIDAIEQYLAETGISKSRNVLVTETVPESDLSDLVGESMANKIRNSKETSGEFEGDDIRIDDLGMYGYYDKILPALVEKIGKKWGAKVTKPGALEQKRKVQITYDFQPDGHKLRQFTDADWDRPEFSELSPFPPNKRPLIFETLVNVDDKPVPIDFVVHPGGFMVMDPESGAVREVRTEDLHGDDSSYETTWADDRSYAMKRFRDIFRRHGSITPYVAEVLGVSVRGYKVEGEGDFSIENQHRLDITPEMRKSVIEGFALFQGKKGAAEFAADGTAIIRGFQSADVSTGLHEIAHVARRHLMDRSIPAEQRQGISDADIAVAEGWAGAKDGQWTKPAEEKFARGFERYLRDGVAPIPQLQRIFESFKAWLSKIYARLRGSDIDVKISKPMSEVFDRLVTRGEIPDQALYGIPQTNEATPSIRGLFKYKADADKYAPESTTEGPGMPDVDASLGRLKAAGETLREVAGATTPALPPVQGSAAIPQDQATKYVKWATGGSGDSADIGRLMVGAYMRQVYQDRDAWTSAMRNALGAGVEEHINLLWRDSAAYLDALKKHQASGVKPPGAATMGFDPTMLVDAAKAVLDRMRGKRGAGQERDFQLYLTMRRIYDRIKSDPDRKAVEGWTAERAAQGIIGLWRRRAGSTLSPDQQAAVAEAEAILERGKAAQPAKPTAVTGGPIRKGVTAVRRALYSEFAVLGEADRTLRKAYGYTPTRPSLDRVFELQPGAATKADADLYEFKRDVIKPILAGKPDQGTAGLAALAKGAYQQKMDQALRILVDAQVISQEHYDNVKKSNDFYTPFRVIKHVTEENTAPPGTGRGMGTGSMDPVKSIVGIHHQDLGLVDLLRVSAEKIVQARVVAEKNLKMLELDKLADVDTQGLLIRRLGPDEQPAKGRAIATLLKNGETVRLEVTEDLARAVKGLSRGETEQVSKMMMLGQSPLRWGAVTGNLGFQTVNLLFADQPSALLLSKYGLGGPIKKMTPAGVAKWVARIPGDLIRWPADFVYSAYTSLRGNFGAPNEEYISWLKSEALNSTIARSFRPESVRPSLGLPEPRTAGGAAKRLPGMILDTASKLSNAVEETTKGMTLLRAKRFERPEKIQNPDLRRAKEQEISSEVRRFGGSPDFLRQGEWLRPYSTAKVLFMFLGARLQGVARDITGIAGAQGGPRAAQAWARLSAAVGLPTMYLMYLNRQKDNSDDYDAIPEDERANYWMIPRYDEKGKPKYFVNEEGQSVRDYYKIPKRETIKLFANVVESGMEFARSRDAQTFAKVAARSLDDLSPVGLNPVSAMNPVVKVPFEWATGKQTYSGRDTVPPPLQGLPAEEQYNARTPKPYIAAARAWNATPLARITKMSPMKIDAAVQGLVGSAPATFAPRQPAEGRGAWTENIVGRRFSRSTRLNLQPFYDAYRPGEQAYNQIRRLMTEGKQEEAIQYQEAHMKELVAYFVLKPVKEQIASYRKTIRLGVARGEEIPEGGAPDIMGITREALKNAKEQAPQQ